MASKRNRPPLNLRPPPKSGEDESQNPDSPATGVDADLVRPRNNAPDAFEQNPLSQVSDRISTKATEGLDDASRVKEALRIVIADGVPLEEAARRCHIAPSFLAQWREKYLTLLNEEPSIATQPLMEKGAVLPGADLVQIPRAAREQFAENWERLVEITRATPSTFRQHPVQVFLENSWLTSWLYSNGSLDRGVAVGAAVALSVIVLTGTFFVAGHFYRNEPPKTEKVENLDDSIRSAAEVAIKFFKADTAEGKMKYVRAGKQVHQLMEDYFRKYPATSIPDASLTKAMPGEGMYALEFDIPSLDRKHLCVVVEKDGQLLVDWETSSIFQEEHLKEIRRLQPRTPVRVAARVTAGEGDAYYNYGFTEAKYSCYRLSYPGLELDLFAYAVRDSLEDQTLQALLRPVTASERNITAVMEVKYPEGEVPSNQVEIVRILQEDWVAP